MRRVKTTRSDVRGVVQEGRVEISKRDYRLMRAVVRAVERRIKIGSYEVELEMEAAYRAFNTKRKP